MSIAQLDQIVDTAAEQIVGTVAEQAKQLNKIVRFAWQGGHEVGVGHGGLDHINSNSLKLFKRYS